MNKECDLVFLNFSAEENPIKEIANGQSKYVYKYLEGLGATSIIIESNYFDRDYLSEFSAFYYLSARGYSNICKRIHFFSGDVVNRDLFEQALGDDQDALNAIQEQYLGFSVIRPIPKSPFGRTIFKWYVDQDLEHPRVTTPSRDYVCHLAGLPLKVKGLAWQQQDTGVAACATIGIWTMMHSSAFDARHSIPTTAMITESAHSSGIVGHRTYPSYSLTPIQIQHAIKSMGFNPSVINSDVPPPQNSVNRFSGMSKRRFTNICAAFIRSGYPLLIAGFHSDDSPVGHAICAVGFRESSPILDVENSPHLQDEQVDYMYFHDDNVGPNVRFKVESEEFVDLSGETQERCVIKMERPDYLGPDDLGLDNTTFYPAMILTAVHEELRIDADQFFRKGIQISTQLGNALNTYLVSTGNNAVALATSARFIMLKDFLGEELSRQFQDQPELLSRTRMGLQEKVPPMSLHLAVMRLSLPDGTSLLDILYDTSDSDRNDSVFCNIVYDKDVHEVLKALPEPAVQELLGTTLVGY